MRREGRALPSSTTTASPANSCLKSSPRKGSATVLPRAQKKPGGNRRLAAGRGRERHPAEVPRGWPWSARWPSAGVSQHSGCAHYGVRIDRDGDPGREKRRLRLHQQTIRDQRARVHCPSRARALDNGDRADCRRRRGRPEELSRQMVGRSPAMLAVYKMSRASPMPRRPC